MATRTDAPAGRTFEHLREHSIGLPAVLFQSITHMAPAAAVAFSILVSIGFAGQALPLAVLLAMIACLLVANSIGQLAKHMPSAGGLYTYNSRALGRGDRLLPHLPRRAALHARRDHPRNLRDRRLRRTRDLDARVERRESRPPGVQPVEPEPGRRERFLRDLQGDDLRHPRVHRVRGGRSPRRGSPAATVDDPARSRRVRPSDRALLRPLLIRVGVRRRLRQLPHAGEREPGPVARARESVLGRRMGARLPRHRELCDRQRKRRGERRDARPVRDGAKRRDARTARPDAPRA